MAERLLIHYKKFWQKPHKLLVKGGVLMITVQTLYVNCPDCLDYLFGK